MRIGIVQLFVKGMLKELICGFTFRSKHKKMRSIILSKNDNTFVTEKEISFFEALKYNFYKEV